MNDTAASPPGWRQTNIGAVTDERKERVGPYTVPPTVLSSTKHYGLVPSDEFFRNRTVYSDDLSNYKRVSENWFAYATNHLAEGSIGIQDQFKNACVSPIYTVFSCREGTDPHYLYRVLKSQGLISQYKLHEQASVDRRGAVRYRDFAKIPLTLPPMTEQQKIVEILDAADDAIRSTERNIAKLEQAKQGLLRDLFTEATGLSSTPNTWTICRLGQMSRYVTYGFTNPMPTTADGPWMLTAADVGYGSVDFGRARHTSASAFNRDLTSKSRPKSGDILITKDGTLGRVAKLETNDICVNQSVAVVRPIDEDWSDFIVTYLLSPIGQDSMLRDSGGSTIKHLYISKLAKLPIPVPPIEDAVRIVEAVKQWESIWQLERIRLRKLCLLREGMTAELLTGRPQMSAST